MQTVSQLNVLLFTGRGDECDEQSRVLEAALRACQTPAVQVRRIDRFSARRADADLVVRHRIVSVPLVVITRGGEEVARILEFPPVDILLGILRTLA